MRARSALCALTMLSLMTLVDGESFSPSVLSYFSSSECAPYYAESLFPISEL